MSKDVMLSRKISNNNSDMDQIVIKFSGYDPNILVQEEYCSNPGCSCSEVGLRFIELSGTGEPVREWFFIKLDIKTWEVTEKKVKNIMIDVNELIKEFLIDIDIIRDKLILNYSRTKGYKKEHNIDYISDSALRKILDGNMLSYSEIYEDSDVDNFYFEFEENEKWFIEDQYCSNHKCLCNDTILTFYKIDESKRVQEAEFAVRMDLKNFKYEVEFARCNTNKIAEINKFLQDNSPEYYDVLRKRYNEVKKTAKEIIRKYNYSEEKEEIQNRIIGRNDLCPCGSGKKYKKCCGR